MRSFVRAALKPVLTSFAFLLIVHPVSADALIKEMSRHMGSHRPAGCPNKWCACYLDKMLESAGFASLGSYRARDFAAYGKKAKPMSVGSIMVMPHHVGVVTGDCGDGRVKIVSGNYSRKVALGCYHPGKAIAWRKPVR